MLIAIKFSGALITDKSRAYTARGDLIRRFASEMRGILNSNSYKSYQFVIVHGGGSFGHLAAKEMNENPSALNFCKIQKSMQDLSKIFTDIFIQEGVPVFPVNLSSSVILKNNKIHKFPGNSLNIIKKLLVLDIVPVTFGVPCIDIETGSGCGIFSGDEILVYLSKKLNADRVISCSITGVIGTDGKPVSEISQANFPEIFKALGKSKSVDVTGGMARKVEELIELAQAGIGSEIVDARDMPLIDIVEGRAGGTKILPRSKE